MKNILLIMLLFSGLLVLPAGKAISDDEPRVFRLLLQWTPQAQFAGYLVAREKGIYKKLGIDLEIIYGGPDKIVSDLLDTGRADFGTMFLATAIERYDAGIPLVNIGQLLHHSSLMLIARSDRGISTIKDLNNQKVAVWANEFQLQTRMLFKEKGVEVDFIPLASSMELFLRRAVTATSAMWYNEYHTILSSGVRKNELRTFFFKDTLYDFPEDGLYCLKDTFKKYPWAAEALLRGTLAGWRYAFSHEQETLDIVAQAMTREKLPVNKAHQRWMFHRMRDILLRDKVISENGVLNRKAFNTVARQLLNAGAVRTMVAYDDFYQGPVR